MLNIHYSYKTTGYLESSQSLLKVLLRDVNAFSEVLFAF